MIYSSNKIMGSLVYRTREALNKNESFMENIRRYPFWQNCLVDGVFNLWHYPGRHNEIANVLTGIKHENAARVKFPAILSFQPIREKGDGSAINGKSIEYKLSIAGVVKSDWLTEARENLLFDPLIYPIYEELIRQIKLSSFFQLDYGIPRHDAFNVMTTGEKSGEMIGRYGDFIDAREIHNMSLVLKSSLCDKDYLRIVNEDSKVTENIEDILKN